MADWRPLAAALAALVMALFVGGRLPWALATGLLVLLICSWIWAWLLRRKLDLLMHCDSWEAQIGNRVKVRVRLDNGSLLPMTWIELDESTPAHLAHSDEREFGSHVPPLGARVFNLEYTVRRRGIYPLGPVTVRTGDPFGIFMVQRTFESPRPLTVLPRILPIGNPGLPLAQPFGSMRTRQQAFEDPSNVAEVRPYQPGDSPRHIHWASSAHQGRWMIRQFELSATTELLLALDLSAGAQFGPPGVDSLEEAVDLAAALANLAFGQNLTMGLVAQGSVLHHVPAGRGIRQFQQVLHALARVEANGAVPLHQMLLARAASLPRQGTLVVITPALDAELGVTLLRLASNTAITVAWICPPEPSEQAMETAGMLSGHGIKLLRLALGDDLAPLISGRDQRAALREVAR